MTGGVDPKYIERYRKRDTEARHDYKKLRDNGTLDIIQIMNMGY